MCSIHGANADDRLNDQTLVVNLLEGADQTRPDRSATAIWISVPEGDATVVPVCVDAAQPDSTGTTEVGTRAQLIRAGGAVYELGAQIARGGMGGVFRAFDRTRGRPVALKALLPEHCDSDKMRSRFFREAKLTARLQHPGVPPVFDMGELADGRPYFTMRLVKGPSLAELLTDRRDFPSDIPRLLKVFEQVCQAVAAAHAHRVIHRDLKPSNILVAGFGTVYVMDWGIARELDQPANDDCVAGDILGLSHEANASRDGQSENCPPLTLHGEILGTLQYMSPEQSAGNPDQDARSDVFSLGAILYEILVGKPVRPPATDGGSVRKLLKIDFNSVSQLLDASRVDRTIAQLARQCLSLNAADRPRDAREVAGAVTAYLHEILSQPERDLARFFELSQDLFCLAGTDGYFKRVNANFSAVLGYSIPELITRPFLDFVHEQDRERTLEQIERLASGFPVVRFENRYRDARGKYRWFEWTAQPVPEEGLIFAAARDITDRKRHEQRFAAMVEAALTAIVMVDAQGLIQVVNSGTERMFGYERSQLVGQPLEMLIFQRVERGHKPLIVQVLENPGARRLGSDGSLLGMRRDGTSFPLEMGLTPFDTDEGRFVLGTLYTSASDVHDS